MSEEILACRVCLATEVKLYNMHQYQLVAAYEVITGSKISITDGLPNHMCSYCSTLLLKCAAFQKRCAAAQSLLHDVLMQNNLITTSCINSIDRETHNLILPYSIKVNLPLEVKDTINECRDVKVESSSDGKLFSNVNKKPRKRHKRNKTSKNVNTNDYNVKIENDNDFDDPTEDLNNDFINDTAQEIIYKQDIVLEEEFNVINFIKQESVDNSNDTKQKVKYEDSDEEKPLSEIREESNKKVLEDETDDLNDEVYVDDDVEVITLSRQEQIDEILARKESPNYINSFYKCDVCYKGFITEVTFKNHMERHDPRSGDYVCEVCGARWASARTLRAHEQSSHLRRYRCQRCDHVAKSSFKAREHSKWHRGVRYVCNVCGAAFAKSTSHLTHVRLRHGGSGGAQCRLCGARLLGECGLRVHMRKAHRFQEKQSTLHCTVCQTTFKTPEALTVHSTNGGGPDSCVGYKWCVHCGSGFESCEGLKVHAEQHREEVACGLCDKRFVSARTLAQHRARAHGGGGGGGGAARAPPARAPPPCVCEVCGHTCTSKATLVYHLRTHTGEKPYQCSECPKRFSVYQRLQIHIRTHTGERPFKCDFCPKAFKHKAALNRHHRVHTGAKPYQCVHCGKAFSQSNSMKGHVRTVHLKLPPPYRNRKRIE